MSTTVKEWLPQYEALVLNRLTSGEIKLKTFGDYKRLMAFCTQTWGDEEMSMLSVSDISEVIQQKSKTAPYAARRLRINMSNMFIEAQREGILPGGHNPALLARRPLTSVKTERLLLCEWLRIYKAAKYCAPPYIEMAMLLAIVTGQRRADIVKMHSSHVREEHLYIEQQKTGERIALPLALRLDPISCSLREIVELCPRNGYLIQAGGKSVNVWSLTRWFQKCREEAGIAASIGRTPPTFREQRSLSERLYREQGIDTRTLLGHKYQRTTDSYNDIRGRDYRKLKL